LFTIIIFYLYYINKQVATYKGFVRFENLV